MNTTDKTIEYAYLNMTKKEKSGMYSNEEALKMADLIRTKEIIRRCKELGIEHEKEFIKKYKHLI